ncbi:rRNA processing protein RRP9 [Ophiocordyceps camponoti-floridani]|uniref:rRNA processing protein RRP9 n=1 Tax=Ophiocordyceps camponoti-floridani TaxID=2030778 RepID=A0A8H4QCH2_9HYPO|nr:rRNA processing protein RRP9 [Ophiocordyceps camponoti-floridani]
MSSFFTIPGSQKKRKRPSAPDGPKKKIASFNPTRKPVNKPSTTRVQRREKEKALESESDDDDDDEDDDEDGNQSLKKASEDPESDESENDEAETAAEKRLRLAERYLDNVKQHVDEAGFDAADIDRDLIAERLQEDVAETKGRLYRRLASELAFGSASQTLFRSNTDAVTSVAVCAPYFYTATKDLYLHKWRAQDLPRDQYPQTTKRKPKKPPAPARKRPQLVSWIRGNKAKKNDKGSQRHAGQILAVAASSDGKYVVTGGEDWKIIVYEASSLKPIKVLTHHRGAVTGLAFRRGTNQLYSSSKDRTVKVWSLDELAYIETLFGHQDQVMDIDALGQERCVSVGARDLTARLWKVAEETQLVYRGGAVDKKPPRPGVDARSLLHEGSMDRIAMIDDDLFVTGSDNGAISLWSVQKKKPLYIEPVAHGIEPPLDPHDVSAEKAPGPEVIPVPTPRWITALRTIPYSDVILSGSWDGHVRVWRLTDDKKKIEPVAVLGGHRKDARADGDDDKEPSSLIQGVVNDIAVFERGDRGCDGLCVIAAVAREHRLGRWTVHRGARNGGFIFEVPRVSAAPVNGMGGRDAEEKEDEAAL